MNVWDRPRNTVRQFAEEMAIKLGALSADVIEQEILESNRQGCCTSRQNSGDQRIPGLSVVEKRSAGGSHGAFPIIRDRLLREDQALHAQLMLVGFFDEDLAAMSALQADEFAKKTEDALQLVRFVGSVVGGRPSKLATQ